MERPQHKVVSLVGTTTRDGRASAFDVVMRLADRIGAACYPVPTTVVTDTVEERILLESRRPWQLIRSLAERASIAMVGIGTLERQTETPLLRDGFITEAERDELIRLGAIGDIIGWAFDAKGRQIEGGSNARLTAISHRLPLERLTIGVAGGQSKAQAIAGALGGRLISGLITDEAAAGRCSSSRPSPSDRPLDPGGGATRPTSLPVDGSLGSSVGSGGGAGRRGGGPARARCGRCDRAGRRRGSRWTRRAAPRRLPA